MNEDILKSQIPSSTPPENPLPEHPLDILHSQTDPYHRAKDLPGQKPIRTYESDVAEILGKQKSSVITIATAENERNLAQQRVLFEKQQAQKINEQMKQKEKTPENLNLKINVLNVEKKDNIMDIGKIAKENELKNIEKYAAQEKQRKLDEQIAREKLQAVREETETKEEIVEEVIKTNHSKKVILVLISFIFITSGVLGGFYLYLNSPVAPAPILIKPLKIPSILDADNQKVIPLGIYVPAKFTETIITELQNGTAENGKILEIVATQQIGTSSVKISGTQFIEAMNFSTPDILKRSLTDKWMAGVYGTEDRNIPFIILTSDFFQNTFAGMLKWESQMPDEIAMIFNYQNTTQGKFQDRVIRNRDIREYVNENGEILFLYTFINQNTVLITTSEAVVPAIVDRIDKQTYIR